MNPTIRPRASEIRFLVDDDHAIDPQTLREIARIDALRPAVHAGIAGVDINNLPDLGTLVQPYARERTAYAIYHREDGRVFAVRFARADETGAVTIIDCGLANPEAAPLPGTAPDPEPTIAFPCDLPAGAASLMHAIRRVDRPDRRRSSTDHDLNALADLGTLALAAVHDQRPYAVYRDGDRVQAARYARTDEPGLITIIDCGIARTPDVFVDRRYRARSLPSAIAASRTEDIPTAPMRPRRQARVTSAGILSRNLRLAARRPALCGLCDERFSPHPGSAVIAVDRSRPRLSRTRFTRTGDPAPLCDRCSASIGH